MNEIVLSFLSARLTFLEIIFFHFFFLSLYFHDLWRSVMSTYLISEIKQQQATLVLGLVTA